MVSLSSSSGFLLLCCSVVCLRARNVAHEVNLTGPKSGVQRHAIALPEIEVLKTVAESPTHFTGTFHSEYSARIGRKDEKMSLEEEQAYMSWEIASPSTGRRVEQIVSVHSSELAENAMEPRATIRGEIEKRTKKNAPRVGANANQRGKRNIFYTDNRHYIPMRSFARRFPFASVVKLSTGCTGTLVSPKHVLTSAHCIHDQKDYVSGFRDLKVGLVRLGLFKWYKVVDSFIPAGWTIGMPDIASKFDYCLLKLENAHYRPFFKLGISENTTNGEGKKIHFTAFEDDKPSNTLWYRYCRVVDADTHVLYHHCDALPGSSGSGVYVWEYDSEDKAWQRKLIGVFSGNRWKYYEKNQRLVTVNYNAAIRINSVKYTQICKWMGSYASKTCKTKYYTS